MSAAADETSPSTMPPAAAPPQTPTSFADHNHRISQPNHPPPLPPPATGSTSVNQQRDPTTTTTVNSDAFNGTGDLTTDHQWARHHHPDVHKACFLARLCAHRPPVACRLRDFAAVLQVGPTCGLTALAMLSRGRHDAGQLLAEAQRRGHTRLGEMFSAAALAEMTRDCLQTTAAGDDAAEVADPGGLQQSTTVSRVWLHEGDTAAECIKVALLSGGCLLVPGDNHATTDDTDHCRYDADFNHGPCLRNGHRAHWALIVGYLIDDDEQFHVFARHGKTRNLAVWSLRELAQSNAQLSEFIQPRAHPDAQFVLPAGGVAAGLRARCIVIEGVRAPLIVIR